MSTAFAIFADVWARLGGPIGSIIPVENKIKNYALQGPDWKGLNFEKNGQIEYGLAKIKAKMFFLHRYLFCLV